jgi:hypothetical protein
MPVCGSAKKSLSVASRQQSREKKKYLVEFLLSRIFFFFNIGYYDWIVSNRSF